MATADRLQRCLMADYPGECGSWMPGIRQLIVRLSPPAESGAAPAVITTSGGAPSETPATAPGGAPGETPAAAPSEVPSDVKDS